MQTIHLLVRDCGDGSITIDAIPDSVGEYLNMLLEEEEYYLNEGTPPMTIKIPDGTSPKYFGLDVWSIEQVKNYLGLEEKKRG